MVRRLRVEHVISGEILLSAAEAHHARDVLRLAVGAEIELFDDAGRVARGTLVEVTPDRVLARADEVRGPARQPMTWSVAAAVPKGQRADWMIEKLSELGTAAFIPLATARSVVLPQGRGKSERWTRLAAEAAKQSRRTGTMRIEELVNIQALLARIRPPAWYFSTAGDAAPVARAMEEYAASRPQDPHELLLLVGPEGGWTEQEMQAFASMGLTAVSLGGTILRVETAAVAAAAVVAAVLAPSVEASSSQQGQRPT